MSNESRRKMRKRTRSEAAEASMEAMFHKGKGRLIAMAKSEKPPRKGTPEWQKNVAIATNAAGVVAGPAAITMAVQQARRKEGGVPRGVTQFTERKSKPTTRTGRVARKTGKILRNPKAIAIGGVTAIGLQSANMAGDAIAARAMTEQKIKDKAAMVNKSLSAQRKREIGSTTAGVIGGGAAGAYAARRLRPEPLTIKGQRANKRAQIARFKQTIGSENANFAQRAAFKENVRSLGHAPGRKVMYRRVPVPVKGAALGAALFGGFSYLDAVMDKTPVKKSIEQSLMSKSDIQHVTGNGTSLIEKRQFSAEADRQRRLGLYAGLGAVGAAAAGTAAASGIKVEGRGTKGQMMRVATRSGKPLSPRRAGGKAGLATLAAISAAGGIGAYRRGISERNYPYV